MHFKAPLFEKLFGYFQEIYLKPLCTMMLNSVRKKIFSFFLRFLVRVSYLEIYNENVRDLLGKDQKAKLEVTTI